MNVHHLSLHAILLTNQAGGPAIDIRQLKGLGNLAYKHKTPDFVWGFVWQEKRDGRLPRRSCSCPKMR